MLQNQPFKAISKTQLKNNYNKLKLLNNFQNQSKN